MRLYLIVGLILIAGPPAGGSPTAAQQPTDKAAIAARARRGPSSRITFPEAPKGITASPEPGFLTVHAQAQLDRSRSGHDTLHYWRLDVLDQAGQVVWKQDYDRREFPVKAGSRVTKDFRERLQLPPGRYLVRVWLLDVKWDLDELGFPALVSTNADGSDHAIMSSYLASVP